MFIRACALFICSLLIPLTAIASDTLHWRCWYDQQVHITCLIDEVPENQFGATELQLPSNLPAIVATLRKDPGAFRNRVLHIPLHTQPLDMDFTALLAQSTVCGSRADCTVDFTAKLPAAEEVVALLDKHRPYLQRNVPAVLAMMDNE